VPEGASPAQDTENGQGLPNMILDATADIFGPPDETLRPDGAGAARRAAPAGVRGDPRALRVAGQAHAETSRRHAESLGAQAQGEAEELLSGLRAHAESLVAQAQGDAEELLSRARAHADLLRVHAEAARAEAECLRAETGALRAAAREEAEAAASRAEALITQAHAAAEELRSAMEGEAAAARAEVERLRAEVASLRTLSQAEIDTGVAEAQRMGAEVQRLWAETDKLGAELRLLSARAQAAALKPPAATAVDGPEGGRAVAEPRPVPPVPEIHAERVGDSLLTQLDTKVAELAREVRVAAEAASSAEAPDHGHHDLTGADGDAQDQSHDQPVDTHEDRPRASQPLIGSGGWRPPSTAGPGTTPVGDPVGAEMPPRRGRRGFRRR